MEYIEVDVHGSMDCAPGTSHFISPNMLVFLCLWAGVKRYCELVFSPGRLPKTWFFDVSRWRLLLAPNPVFTYFPTFMLLVKKGGGWGGVISLMVLLLLSRIGSVLVYAMLVLVLPFPRLLVGGRWLMGRNLPGILSLVRSLLCFVTETFNVKQGSLK